MHVVEPLRRFSFAPDYHRFYFLRSVLIIQLLHHFTQFHGSKIATLLSNPSEGPLQIFPLSAAVVEKAW